MFKVILSRVCSDNDVLRTPYVEGVTESLPEKGSRFQMLAQALDNKFQLRHVSTSLVESVETLDDKITFRTLNSVYELEILK